MNITRKVTGDFRRVLLATMFFGATSGIFLSTLNNYLSEVHGFDAGNQRPPDADVRVVITNDPLMLAGVIIRALVNELGLFTQHIKSVSKARWYPNLVFVF